jgi:ankyrin repeat protein
MNVVCRAIRIFGNDQDQRKIAAFELCKKNGIVAEQLEERNEMSETPLIREAADGDARAVHWLLEAGADVHARMENRMGFTAVNQAAYFGNASCLTYLLDYKADPCVLDRSGGTPLVAAALNGELECIQMLLQAGVDRTFDERVLRSAKSKDVFDDAEKAEKVKDPDHNEETKNLRKQSSPNSPLYPC